MRRPLVFVLLLGLIVLPARGQENPPEAPLSADEQAVVDGTNAERKKAGLPILKPNAKLLAAARAHAANMAKQSKLEHTLDNKTPGDRVTAAGYKFARTGENIAWNHQSPRQAVEGWMKSEGHKANILTKEYSEIGVAVAKNGKGEPYWVQVFGAPR